MHVLLGMQSGCLPLFATCCRADLPAEYCWPNDPPHWCRSLLERLLRARLVYQQPSAARAISFEYLNRQLVWSELRQARFGWQGLQWSWTGASAGNSGLFIAQVEPVAHPRSFSCYPLQTLAHHVLTLLSPTPPCSELLLFLLPLLNVKAIKRILRSHLPRLPLLGGAASRLPGSGGGAAAAGGGADSRQPCGICNAAEVLQPWAAVPCGHQFCYYCLRSHCLADPQYSCPLCLSRVEAMQRAAVPAGAASSSSGKDGGGSGDNDVG